jgi:hypothetical protein
MSTTLDNITNELIKQYDIKFNNNYKNIVQVNSSIQNKEELIYKIQGLIFYKERNIIILQYFTFFVLISCILFLIHALGKMQFKQFMGIVVILFIVMAIACYIHIIYYFNLQSIDSRIRGLKVYMKDYTKKELENRIPDYTCPNTCTTKPSDEGYDITEEADYVKYDKWGQVLKTDPSLNVWKYGDVPINQDIQTMAEMDDEDSPQPFFGTTYPKSIYYQCKWLGGIDGMPRKMKNGLNKYSTIPCDFKPNTTQKARYICDNDPNEVGIEECEEIN